MIIQADSIEAFNSTFLWFSVACFCVCGSLLLVFGVRVSMTFHLTCVHFFFSSDLVAGWPPSGK